MESRWAWISPEKSTRSNQKPRTTLTTSGDTDSRLTWWHARTWSRNAETSANSSTYRTVIGTWPSCSQTSGGGSQNLVFTNKQRTTKQNNVEYYLFEKQTWSPFDYQSTSRVLRTKIYQIKPKTIYWNWYEIQKRNCEKKVGRDITDRKTTKHNNLRNNYVVWKPSLVETELTSLNSTITIYPQAILTITATGDSKI